MHLLSNLECVHLLFLIKKVKKYLSYVVVQFEPKSDGKSSWLHLLQVQRWQFTVRPMPNDVAITTHQGRRKFWKSEGTNIIWRKIFCHLWIYLCILGFVPLAHQPLLPLAPRPPGLPTSRPPGSANPLGSNGTAHYTAKLPSYVMVTYSSPTLR